MKSTFLEYFEFVAAANNFLQQHPEESKLKYALEKVGKLNKNLQTDYQDLCEDERANHCLKNDKGHFMIDEQGRKCWNPSADKAYRNAVKALNDKEIEVKTWAYDLSQDEFTDEEAKNIFAKFLINEDKLKIQ